MINIYKADGDTQVVLMKNVKDPEDAIDPPEEDWVKLKDVVGLIDNRILYLETNKLYPAFGLNSQVESLKQLRRYFVE